MALREKCSYSEILWSAFSGIRTEYGKMRTRMTLNTDTFLRGDGSKKSYFPSLLLEQNTKF